MAARRCRRLRPLTPMWCDGYCNTGTEWLESDQALGPGIPGHPCAHPVDAQERGICVASAPGGRGGYLLKDADVPELALAITAATRGEMYLSPPISKQLIREYMQRVGSEATGLERLTPRQREILQLIAEVYTTKAIAQRLGLGIKTIETHRVRYAIRMGLVLPDP
jgi:hypothetical protein